MSVDSDLLIANHYLALQEQLAIERGDLPDVAEEETGAVTCQNKYAPPYYCNGNPLTVVTTYTTGDDPINDSIYELCILLVKKNFVPNMDALPFHISIKPWTEPTKPRAHRLSKAMKDGLDLEEALKLFHKWIDHLDLPYRKYGYERTRLMPIGYNYGVTKISLIHLIGPLNYYAYFHRAERDILQICTHWNDRAYYCGRQIPFPKVDLPYILTCLKTDHYGRRNCLTDAFRIAEAYRRLSLGTPPL